MTHQLQKVGNSRGIVLTRLMLEHLGVTDEVEIEMEKGRIVITAPRQRHRTSNEEANQAIFTQHAGTLRRLADAEEQR